MAVETRKLDFRFTTIPLTLVSYGKIYKSLYSSSIRTFKVPTQNFRTKTVGSKQPYGIRDCYQYPKEVIDSQTQPGNTSLCFPRQTPSFSAQRSSQRRENPRTHLVGVPLRWLLLSPGRNPNQGDTTKNQRYNLPGHICSTCELYIHN